MNPARRARVLLPALLLAAILAAPTSGSVAKAPGALASVRESPDRRTTPLERPALVPAAAPLPGPSLSWTSLTNGTVGSPPVPRLYPGWVYDPALDATVLFGGALPNGTLLNDTWTLGPSWNWSEGNATPAPSPRSAPAIAYDAAERCVVLFGGQIGPTRFNGDTWTFANGSWTRLITPTGPPESAGALLLPSPNGSGLILSGGLGPHGLENGTWYFQGSSWTNVTGTLGAGPTPRTEAAGAFLPGPDVDVIFGGNGTNTTNASGPAVPQSDTWVLNATGWSKLGSIPGDVPAARYGAGMAWDGLDRTALLFGGASSVLSTLLTPVWSFNGTGWSEAMLGTGERPHVRFGAGFTGGGPSDDNTTLLYGGGSGNGTAFAGLWEIGSRAPLLVPPPVASVADVDSGVPVVLNESPIGGVAPLTFRWSGLPDGCVNETAATVTCVPRTNASLAAYYRPTVRVTDATGVSRTSTGGSLEVNGLLRVVRLDLVPSSLTIGSSLAVNVSVAGGGRPLSIAFRGLPEGCLSANLSGFVCTPIATGTFSVNVTVVDPFGENASLVALVTIVPAPISAVQLIGLGLAVAAVIAIGVIVWRGRRASRAKAAPPAAPASPPSAGPTAPKGPT